MFDKLYKRRRTLTSTLHQLTGCWGSSKEKRLKIKIKFILGANITRVPFAKINVLFLLTLTIHSKVGRL